MAAKKKPLGDPPYAFTYENGFVIRPRLPIHDGIFHLGPDVLIASHPPHKHIPEHLHDHFYHLHIRYGFEIPQQSLSGVSKRGLAPQVAMLITNTQRVDCNPVFVAKGEGAEGICLKIAGQDVHWVHDESVGKKATKLFQATGRCVPDDARFIGFSTNDVTRVLSHATTPNKRARSFVPTSYTPIATVLLLLPASTSPFRSSSNRLSPPMMR